MPPNSGFLRGRLRVGVGVERVAGELGEVVDVGERDLRGTRRRSCRRSAARRGSCGTGARPSTVCCEPVVQRPVIAVSMSGERLDRGALHVVQHAADAAELLAAAGAAGSAVHQHRQRRAVAGGLRGVVAVEHQDPAVPRREAEHDRARDVGVVGDDRADQAAAAAGGEGDRLVEAVVRDHGADRAERLDVVRLAGPVGGAQQQRRQERAALGVGVDDVDPVGVAEDDLGGAAQRLDGLAHLVALAEATPARPSAPTRRRGCRR